jgi:hypothetical protein
MIGYGDNIQQPQNMINYPNYVFFIW